MLGILFLYGVFSVAVKLISCAIGYNKINVGIVVQRENRKNGIVTRG